MNSDERIIELLSDMLDEQRGMRKDINEMKNDISEMKNDINEMKNDISEMKNDISQLKEQQIITNKRLEKLEDHQIKTNLAIGELRLSVMKLADRLEIIAEHEKRIDRLEQAVFHSS